MILKQKQQKKKINKSCLLINCDRAFTFSLSIVPFIENICNLLALKQSWKMGIKTKKKKQKRKYF